LLFSRHCDHTVSKNILIQFTAIPYYVENIHILIGVLLSLSDLCWCVFSVGTALLGLQRVCGSGRGIRHCYANSWAISVHMPLCWSLWCQASLWRRY